MTTDDRKIQTELGRLRGRLPELWGSVLATVDGMVIAHDSHGVDPDSLAALAAAHLSLARRFALVVNHGDLRESVVQCTGGYITSYTAGPEALLTIVTAQGANLAIVHLEARRCVRRLADLLDRQAVRPQIPSQTTPSVPLRPQIPSQTASSVPLTRRTPMAGLPANVRHRRATG